MKCNISHGVPSYLSLCVLLGVNERGEYMMQFSMIAHKAILNFVLYYNILVSLITTIYTDVHQYIISPFSHMYVTDLLPDNKHFKKHDTEY